jgi:hypothetical protein
MVSFYKKSVSLIILCAFMLQALYSPFLLLHYYLNTASYEKNCINKAKKWMHCNGKCQLMKKILEQEKKEEKNSEMKFAGKTELISSFTNYLALYKPVLFKSFSNKSRPHNTGSPVDNSLSFFHPPSLTPA